MRALSFALLAACTLTGCVRPAPRSSAAPAFDASGSVAATPRDSATAALIAAAGTISRIRSEMVAAWPGFWRDTTPVLLYSTAGGAVLVTSGQAPSGFVPVHGPDVPRSLRGRIHLHAERLPGLAGNVDPAYRLGAYEVAAVPVTPDSAATADLLFHEAFHGYQARSFAGTAHHPDDPWLAEPALDLTALATPRLVALAEVERTILRLALDAPDDALAGHVREYLAVRTARLGASSREASQSFVNIERKEGSAMRVGSRAAALVGGLSASEVPQQVRAGLAEGVSSTLAPYERFRAHAYYSGSALAWLLDRRGYDWRSALQQGSDFGSLVAASVAGDSTPSQPRMDDVLQAYGFAEVLAAAEQWRSTLDLTDPVERFARSGTTRLTIEFAESGGTSAAFQGGGTGLPVQLEGGKVVIMQGAQVFNFDYRGIVLTSEKLPYMLDFRESPSRVRASLMLPAPPRIQGWDGNASRVEWASGGEITAEGLQFRLNHPAILTVQGNEITVRVAPAASR